MNQLHAQFPAVWPLVAFPHDYCGIRLTRRQIDNSQRLFNFKTRFQDQQASIGSHNTREGLFSASGWGLGFLPLNGYRDTRIQANATTLLLHFGCRCSCRLRLHDYAPDSEEAAELLLP